MGIFMAAISVFCFVFGIFLFISCFSSGMRIILEAKKSKDKKEIRAGVQVVLVGIAIFFFMCVWLPYWAPSA